jgi:hypothetical protein
MIAWTPPARWRDEWPSLLAIVAVFAGGWLFVSPWRNVPIIDDWVYAWSVEHLVKTGRLAVLDFSSIYPIAQALWGALFASVAGFSFGILRLSTVVISTVGCWALYLTMREVGVDPSSALIATLAVALSPVYFSLSFSFMTDVPFTAVSTIAAYFYVSGIVRDRPMRFWTGSAFALCAFLIRPLGVVLPMSAALGYVGRAFFEPPSAGSNRLRQGDGEPAEALAAAEGTGPAYFWPLAVSITVMVVLWIAMPRIFGRLPVEDRRVSDLRSIWMITAKEYADWNLNLLWIAAFPLAPMLLARLTSLRRAIAAIVVGAVLMGVAYGILRQVPTPLPDWQTWSLQDLATRGGLLGGDLQPSSWSVHAMPFLRVLGALVAGSFLLAVSESAKRRTPAAIVVAAIALCHVALFNVLWFFNDRYYIVLLPPLAFLAAARTIGNTRRVAWIAAPLLTLWAFISFTGTRDMIATNDVVARLAQELEARGVPPSEIDAGYSLNGWRLYAHPENLPPGAVAQYDVPFVTSAHPTRYRIVNAPGPDENVLKTEPLPAALWQVSDRVYVVERIAHQ